MKNSIHQSIITLQINENQIISVDPITLLEIISEEYEINTIDEFLTQYTWDDAKYIQENYPNAIL